VRKQGKQQIIRACWIVILLSGLQPLTSQNLPSVTAESVGLSSSRLNRVATAVDQAIQDKRIAGAVTLVMRHGKVAWLKAQGLADKEAGKTMVPDAIFRVCSMSKPITSTAVMMLYEEGRFLLSDPISKFIPEFKNPKVLVTPAEGSSYMIPAKREITIHDLLTHTSGLTYQWNNILGARYFEAGITHGLIRDPHTIGENVKILAGLPLLFSPGERFEYSLSIDVLGYLVEVVSGLPLDRFLKSRIFDPLQMNDTFFFVPDEKASRLATAYTWYEEKGLQRFPKEPIREGSMVYSADYPSGGPRTYFSGGGGLCSTASDYARFCQMFLNNGKAGEMRLLSRKTVELMTHDQLGKTAPEMSFGLGFGVDGNKAPLGELGSPGGFGWGGFFYTLFFVDPQEDLVGIFMGQLHPTGGLALDRTFEVLTYQAIND
jgi:CubicO group peptidase (beta-lactamase class C family)